MDNAIRTYAVLWVWSPAAPLKVSRRTMVVVTRAYTANEAREQTGLQARQWALDVALPRPQEAPVHAGGSCMHTPAWDYDMGLNPTPCLVVPVEENQSIRLPKAVRTIGWGVIDVCLTQAEEALAEFFSSAEQDLVTVRGRPR